MIKDIPLILLAGGKSSRMGFPKGFLKIANTDGIDLLIYQIITFLKIGGENIYLVFGHHYQEYKSKYSLEDVLSFSDVSQLQDFFCKFISEKKLEINNKDFKATIKTIFNDKYELGPFSSIQCGLHKSFSQDNFAHAFILPIDTLFPSTHTWNLLYQYKDRFFATIPTFNGKGGHPILINKNIIEMIFKLDASDKNARLDYLIKNLDISKIKRIETNDPLIQTNINSPKDLQ